jgi:hypothetical protein
VFVESGIRERCVEQPQAGEAPDVGNYRMLDNWAGRAGGLGVRTSARVLTVWQQKLERLP